MSKLFYDPYINLKKVENEIKKVGFSVEEREELFGLVDEIVNSKVLNIILDELPEEKHIEFLGIFHKSPHDDEVIFGYLGNDIKEKLKNKLEDFDTEIINEIRPQDEVSAENGVSKK